MSNSKIKFIFCMHVAMLLLASTSSEPDSAENLRGIFGIEHVIFIGVDALSPDGIQTANTPNIEYLMENGTFTLKARAVMPTYSSPNWASMIMGAGPEQHGITSNDWEPDNFDITPTDTGSGEIFPTIFSLLHDQKPELTTAVFHDWDGFGRLFEHNHVDTVYSPGYPSETTEDRVQRAETTMAKAVRFVKEHKPGFMFIQLDHVDHFGHHFSHGSEEYYQSVQHADSLVGTMLKALEEAGIAKTSVVMISADHGGIDNGHGGATDNEILIPWIISGPQVAPRLDLGPYINTYDTAATIAHIFGVRPPKSWIATPVLNAFVDSQ